GPGRAAQVLAAAVPEEQLLARSGRLACGGRELQIDGFARRPDGDRRSRPVEDLDRDQLAFQRTAMVAAEAADDGGLERHRYRGRRGPAGGVPRVEVLAAQKTQPAGGSVS